jgi:hypothetical protein
MDAKAKHPHEVELDDDVQNEVGPTVEEPAPSIAPEQEAELDEDERRFRAMRLDTPGVKDTSAIGIVTIAVSKIPGKNEFFRTHPTFRPVVGIVNLEVGMENQFYAVAPEMVRPLADIGITVTPHVLYLTVTSSKRVCVVPVRQASGDMEQNEWNRTKEIGLLQAIDEWKRLYSDTENKCYQVFQAPPGRFGEPHWPNLKDSKIYRLAFYDKGREIDSAEHPLYVKWTARDGELRFREIWLADFEFVPQPGELPDVVCLCAYELRTGRTLSLWRNQLDPLPPYHIDDNALFVCFVANAEGLCHLALGWPLPANVLDLSPVFRNISNGRDTPEGKGLIGAQRYYGLDTIATKQKEAMQQRVIKGWPFTTEEQHRILEYCLSDVMALERLMAKLMAEPEFNLDIALFHGQFAAVSAVMEFNGVPIDMQIFPHLADYHTWRAVRDAMVPKIGAQYGVFVQNAAGDWTFSTERFKAYLQREGIDWPLLETGKLNLRRKTFENMTRGFPQLENLRQLKHARDKMRKVKLAVGNDGRNRTVLWPFQSKTSRTQPKSSFWIFSPAVWLRSLVKPAPGMAVAYIDYSSTEFLIAAALSDGHRGPVNNMLDMYRSGDPYTAFARTVGALPKHIVRDTPEWKAGDYDAVRDKYKVMMLATQYGMQTTTLAARLGVSTLEAHEMLAQHRVVFSQYWAWSQDWVQHALQTGVMRTAFGWYRRTGITEFNERSIANWPIQSAGADILRVACIMAVRHGIRLLAPVHDAVLIEAPIDRIDTDVALMREIMRRASRVVLNRDASGTIELRTDYKIVRYPDRYSDKRGAKIWDEVVELLAGLERKKKTA